MRFLIEGVIKPCHDVLSEISKQSSTIVCPDGHELNYFRIRLKHFVKRFPAQFDAHFGGERSFHLYSTGKFQHFIGRPDALLGD